MLNVPLQLLKETNKSEVGPAGKHLSHWLPLYRQTKLDRGDAKYKTKEGKGR